MTHNPIAHYDGGENVLTVIAPTLQLIAKGKEIPGAHFRKKTGVWAAPATAGVAARLVRIYGKKLEGTPEFKAYLAEQIEKNETAQSALTSERLPKIPITAVQPEGKWYHQRRAFWFAYPLDAAMLAITMGGGKTKIAIDLMMNWKSRQVLIITPMAAIEDVWQPQMEKYMKGLRVARTARRSPYDTVAQFTEMAQYALDYPTDHNVVIINHEAFWREPFRTWSANQDWDLIIDDEIHREKSAGSFQSKFLFQLSSRARRRLGLTGTPMPHSPLDVYGQYRFLDRGVFGTNHDRFLEEYAEMGGYQEKQIVGFRNIDRLTSKFYSIGMLIEDSEQGLPETVDIEHKVTLEPKVRKVYAEMDENFIANVGKGTITAANAGVKLLRLHQLACGIAKTDDGEETRVSTARLDGLRDVIQDFNINEPIVIFVRFKRDLHDIVKLLRSMRRSASMMGDGVNGLQDWKKEKTTDLVAQIQAVKEGVDLTRSSVGIFYSTGLSLGDYLQCRKRLHRPPQTRMVRFIHILAKATRDISTMRSLRERRDVVRDALAVAEDGA